MRVIMVAVLIFTSAAATAGEYRSLIAVSLGMASLKNDAPVTVKKPKRADCSACKGTGRVRTGDGLGWTECDACELESQVKRARSKGHWIRVRTCKGNSCRYEWIWREEKPTRPRRTAGHKS